MQTNEIQILGFMDNSDGSLEIANRVYNTKGVSPCLNAHANDTTPKIAEVKSIKIRQATEQGFAMCEVGGGWQTWTIQQAKREEEE